MKKKSTVPHVASMTVRFTDAERAAIAKAGDAEQREPAVLVRMVMLEWLKDRGYLK